MPECRTVRHLVSSVPEWKKILMPEPVWYRKGDPVRYQNTLAPDWDTRCRNADAGGIELGADAQSWLNMELYLQSIFPLHGHSFILIGRDPTTPFPPPPCIWAHIRGRYWSAKIDDIYLWPPALFDQCVRLGERSLLVIWGPAPQGTPSYPSKAGVVITHHLYANATQKAKQIGAMDFHGFYYLLGCRG